MLLASSGKYALSLADNHGPNFPDVPRDHPVEFIVVQAVENCLLVEVEAQSQFLLLAANCVAQQNKPGRFLPPLGSEKPDWPEIVQLAA